MLTWMLGGIDRCDEGKYGVLVAERPFLLTQLIRPISFSLFEGLISFIDQFFVPNLRQLSPSSVEGTDFTPF